MFEKLKKARANRLEARGEAEAAAREASERAALHEQTQGLAAAATEAHDVWKYAKLDDFARSVEGVVLKKNEVVYLSVEGAGFIEPKRMPGHWAGRSSGYSFRVAKGVSYRMGGSRGQYVPGEEQPTVTDMGRFVVTNQRCMFMGAKRNTEWAYSKLLGYSIDGEATAIFSVSNRQKTTGVIYTPEVESRFDAVIAAAVAKFQGDEVHAELVAELEADYRTAYDAWKASEQLLNSGDDSRDTLSEGRHRPPSIMRQRNATD